MSEPERILVAGAGIGGLTAARALLCAGFRVHVVERAESLSPVGAGITVQINAMLALRGLELDGAVAAAGNSVLRGVIADTRGRELAAMEMTRLQADFGAPMVAIHRARLQEVLLGSLGADVVETGAAAASFEQDADGVTLRLQDGRTLRGAALVGADGLRSAVRAQLLGDGAPRYSGYTSWRGVATDGGRLPRERVVEAWGRGRRFGIVPIAPELVYWFATADAPQGRRDPDGTSLERVRGLFGDWFDDVGLLLDSTRPEDVVHTDICDRAPSERWGQGRVTLLGDAAHAMTPNLGQGGCQAIEDAVVLADALVRAGSVEPGLRAYERRRMDRTREFVEQSWRLGRMAQSSNPVLAALRNVAMRLTPSRVAERSLRRRIERWNDAAA